LSKAGNANFDAQMMMIAGVVVCGALLAALSVFAFPPSNKKKNSE
jgi:hypothetical protein